jgi:hypothetical protein
MSFIISAVLQDPTTPTPQPLTGITQHRFSHHPLSFATTHGDAAYDEVLRCKLRE